VRLAHLEADNQRRRAIAARYRAALSGRLASPAPAFGDVGVEHLFVVRHPRRELFRQALAEAGVATAIHYPMPGHLQRAYRPYGAGEGSLPETELACAQVVSLPMYPELTDHEVERVLAALEAALRQVPAD
jgi:dTDP-4-amino-4,6-dideoxygalactose transaminase